MMTLSASELEEELETPDPLDVNITDEHIDQSNGHQ
jgi:hypothetical protein